MNGLVTRREKAGRCPWCAASMVEGRDKLTWRDGERIHTRCAVAYDQQQLEEQMREAEAEAGWDASP